MLSWFCSPKLFKCFFGVISSEIKPFICQRTKRDAMVRSGAAGLHFGNKIDMTDALSNCPENLLVMGNLDHVELFKHSSADKVYTKTMDLLEKNNSLKNFVLSTGCDVPPHVPFKNIEAFYQALDDFNSQLT